MRTISSRSAKEARSSRTEELSPVDLIARRVRWQLEIIARCRSEGMMINL